MNRTPKAVSIGAAFGAALGFIFGLERLEPSLNQELYWLWLGLWVGSGALLGVAGMYVLRSLMRRG